MPGNWQPTQQPDVPLALMQAVGGHPLVARLLARRVLALRYAWAGHDAQSRCVCCCGVPFANVSSDAEGSI